MYKRIYILIILMIIIASCSTVGSGKIDFGFTENMLLKINKHNIELTMHPDSNIGYFTDKMTIDFSQRKNRYSGTFLLDNNMDLYSVSVNGSYQMVRTVESFSNEYFGNELSSSQTDFIKNYVNIFEVELPPLEDNIDSLEVTIKYILKASDKSNCCLSASDLFVLKEDYLWYPTDLRLENDINLVVKAPKRFVIEANSSSGKIETNSEVDNSTSFQFKDIQKIGLKGYTE